MSDPHNLGAILRSAECAGAHGVIIPKRRSVGLTATVAKASAGAVEYMKVARVTNINTAIAELKDKGVWVFGTAAEGSIPMYKADLTVPAAIVIGNEGEGLSQLVRKNCDVMVSIPMKERSALSTRPPPHPFCSTRRYASASADSSRISPGGNPYGQYQRISGI